MTVTLYTFARFGEMLRNFSEIYSSELGQLVLCPMESMVRTLKPARERVCRFCGRDATSTKFNKIAHAIPEMLGNKYLLSDSECDDCNEAFSKLENDLANFLGAARALGNVSGKKKHPTFKSPNGELTVRKEEFYGAQGTSITRKDADNQTFAYDATTGILDISYLKLPYIPLNVYKALLKIALSVMPAEHLGDYAVALRRLLHDPENTLAHFATVGVFEMPLAVAVRVPRCHIAHKATPDTRACTHLVTLYFQQFVFCINVPLSAKDWASKIYASEGFQFYLCPPLFFHEPNEELAAFCIGEWKNLAATEPVRERQFVSVNMGPDAFRNTQMYDPATGLFRPSTEALPDIVTLFMTTGDERPDFPIGPFEDVANNGDV